MFEIPSCRITVFYCLAQEKKTINVRHLCQQRLIFLIGTPTFPSFFVPPALQLKMGWGENVALNETEGEHYL